MNRLVTTAALALALSASAQSSPELWGSAPGMQVTAGVVDAGTPASSPAPPLEPGPPMPLPPLPGDAPERSHTEPPGETIATVATPVEPQNAVSMLGALPLGKWNRGESVIAGFPLISLRALMGVSDSLDLGLGFDSFWGVLNEFRLVGRLGIFQRDGWQVGANLELGGTLFTIRANREVRGPRWMTGRRNWNISPAVVASYQGSAKRAVRLFAELRYLLALDTEPFSRNPLDGVPANVQLGHNVGLQAGAEFPLSAKTSFVVLLGLMVHGRYDDSVLMPTAQLGVTTSL